MCLILRLKTTDTLTPDEIRDVYARNRDGAGIAYVGADRAVYCARAVPVDADDCVRLVGVWLDAARADGAAEVVIHWRMATHGPVSREMAHPFRLASPCGSALMHNGVISGLGGPDRSDTAEFAASLGPAVATHGHTHPDVVAAIRKHTPGSVIVIVAPDGIHWHGREITRGDRVYSNSYAWSDPEAPKATTWSRYGWRWTDDDDDDDDRPVRSARSVRSDAEYRWSDEFTASDDWRETLQFLTEELQDDRGDGVIVDLAWEAWVSDDADSLQWAVSELIGSLDAETAPGLRWELLATGGLSLVTDWSAYLSGRYSESEVD